MQRSLPEPDKAVHMAGCIKTKSHNNPNNPLVIKGLLCYNLNVVIKNTHVDSVTVLLYWLRLQRYLPERTGVLTLIPVYKA